MKSPEKDRYRFHDRPAHTLGGRYKAKRDFRALAETFRQGRTQPLLDAVGSSRFSSEVLLAMHVELAVSMVSQSPRSVLALTEALEPLLRTRKLDCLSVQNLAARTASQLGECLDTVSTVIFSTCMSARV